MPISAERIESGDPHLVVVREGALLRVTIDRADKHNPLSRPILSALRRTFEAAAADPTLGCVLLRGAGSRYFAAGGDLRDLDAVRSAEDTARMSTDGRAALDAVRDCPVPVVALVNGDAIGGGAELAVACDFRIMRRGAHIGYVHGRLAITSAWGGGPDLASLVGPSRALRMTSRCELVGAELALAWGLADAVADEAALDDEATRFVEPMLRQSRRALRACKAQARSARRGASYEERRALEQASLVETWTHSDHWLAVERVLSRSETSR